MAHMRDEKEDERLVFQYAVGMAAELNANAHKGTWEYLAPSDLLADVHVHMAKLELAYRDFMKARGRRIYGLAAEPGDEDTPARVKEYAFDVGNLLAMMLDVAGLLDRPENPDRISADQVAERLRRKAVGGADDHDSY